jgi:hypothetical protein
MTSRQILGSQSRRVKTYSQEELEGELDAAEQNMAAKPAVKPIAQNTTDLLRDSAKYLLLPGRTHGNYSYPNTVISLDMVHQGLSWHDTHKALTAEGKYMPTIRQFVDFINELKSGQAVDASGEKIKDYVVTEVYNSIFQSGAITKVRWLNAIFYKISNEIYMNSSHRFNQANPTRGMFGESSRLLPCLTQNRVELGIDICDWLARATEQGLPPEDTHDGKLHYYAPRFDLSIARFVTGSRNASLICATCPRSMGPSYLIGVHSAQDHNTFAEEYVRRK